MGSVKAYDTPAGKRYRARWRTPEHQQRQKVGFTTKKAAEAHLTAVEGSKLTGAYVDAAAARATVTALGAQWLASRANWKPSTRAVYESAWRIHVEPHWGEHRVGDIRHSAVQAWIATLATTKSPTMVRRCHDVLAGILDAAVADRRISSNPARGVDLPRKITRKERRYLSHEQVRAVAEASGGHETVVLVLAYCGIRWGELSALRVRDLDMLKRRLVIRENAVLVRGEVVVGTPKSGAGRSVPFPRFLAEPLARACEGKGADGLVFPDRYGHHQKTPTVRYHSWWDRALETADVPPLTIHDLRHTAASLSISAGANVKAVQRMLGHASAAMTLDTYADLFDDDLDTVSAALDDARLASSVAELWPNGRRAPVSDAAG